MLDYGEKDSLTELLNRKSFDGAFLRAALEQDSLAEDDGPERRANKPSASYWLAVLDSVLVQAGELTEQANASPETDFF